MATKFITPNWRMPKNSNQSKASNYSLDFDGSSYISLPSSLDLGTNSTISLWFKSDSGNANHTILGEDSYTYDYLLQVASAGNDANIRIGSVYKTFTVTEINDGNWNHWCIVRNGDSVELFINNSSKGTQTGYGTGTNTKFEKIGAEGDNQFPITGKIAQLSAFDYALTGSAVTALYNNGIPSNPLAVTTPPIAYYDLGQGSAYASGSAGIVEPNLAQATGSTVFEFDGPNANEQYITTTYFPNGETNFTYSTWLNCNFHQRGTPLAAYGGSTHQNFKVQFWTDTGGAMYVFVGGAYGFFANFSLHGYPGDKWTNISVVYDGTFTDADTATQNAGRLKLYINGNYEAFNSFNGTIPSTIPSGNTGFYLGTQTPTTLEYGGEMSNVMMFDNSLPATGTDSVETLYNNGTPLQSYTDIPQSGSLKAWYKLGLDTSTWGGDGWINGDSTANYNKVLSRIESNTTITDAGSGDRVNCGNDSSLQITRAMSISLWFRVNTISPAHSYNFVMGRSRFGTEAAADAVWTLLLKGVSYGNPAHFRFKLSDGTTATNYVITETTNGDFFNNKWQNLIITYDGTTNANSIKAYLNGELHQQFTSAQSGINNIAARNLTFYDNDVYQYGDPTYTGALSNCAIWNKKLEASDISSIWNEGKPALTMPSEAELQGWWKFSDGTYNTSGTSWSFPDSSQNTNTGSTNTFAATAVPFDVNSVKTDFVSSLNGESSGMDTTNLVPSNLIKSIPYSGYSMDFDGIGNYIDCGNDSSLSPSSFTFSVWTKSSQLNLGTWIGKYASENYGFGLYSGDIYLHIKTSAGWGGLSVTASSYLTVNNWHHIVGTYDETNLKIYVDGNLAGTLAKAGPITYTTRNTRLGNLEGTSALDYDGFISNVSIFNRALTQDEIIRIYNGGSPGNLSSLNPTSWWSLGVDSYFNGSNWICPDLIGSNNGTSSGMAAANLVGNGPDSLANGTSTNLDLSSDLVGNAPGSTGNAISVNMNFTARTGSTP